MPRVEFAYVPCAKHRFSIRVPAALEVSPAISSSSIVHMLGVATSEDSFHSFCVKLLFTFPLVPACGCLSLSFADLLMLGTGERPQQIKLRALIACVTQRSLCHKWQKSNSDQLMRKAVTYWLAYLRSLGWQVAVETGGPGLHTPSSGLHLSTSWFCFPLCWLASRESPVLLRELASPCQSCFSVVSGDPLTHWIRIDHVITPKAQ